MCKRRIGAVIVVIVLLGVVFTVVLKSTTPPENIEHRRATQAKAITTIPTKTPRQSTTGRADVPPDVAGDLPSDQKEIDIGDVCDDLMEHYSQTVESMLSNPIHPGRRRLQAQMREETPEETFLNLTDNDNFAMLMPLLKNRPFSPGQYESDVVIVCNMTRVRKLLTDARKDPLKVAAFLEQQIRTLAAEYPSQCEAFQRQQRQADGGVHSDKLPDCIKTRLLSTAAVYVLSQTDTTSSLSTLAWLSRQETRKRKNSLPVNRKFLFYAMHNLVQKSHGTNDPERYVRYLERARDANIPDAKRIKVTAWNSHFHEGDYRRMLPDRRINLEAQPTIELEQFPSLRHLGNGKINSLLRDLRRLAG